MSEKDILDGAGYLKSLLNASNPDECFESYQRITDFFPALVYVYDTKKKNLGYINKRFSDFLGFTEEDFQIEDSWLNIIFKEDKERFHEELSKFETLKDEDSHTFQNRFNKKDGSWRYFKTSGKVWKRNSDGKAEAVLMIAEDITENVSREEELLKSKELIRDTERMNKYGMFSYDTADDSFTWSDGMFDLFELNKELVPAKITREYYMNFLQPSEKTEVNTFVVQQYETGNDFEHEYNIITAKGNEKTLVNTVKIVKDENGNVIKSLGTARDITKEKNIERELQKTINDLNTSNSDLEEFAYIASHDMQEPLRKITTFSSRLLEKYSSQLGPEGKIYIDRIDAAAVNMRLLIDNLLEISRTARSKQPFIETDLNEILHKNIVDLELVFEEHKVAINISKLPVIECVASQIQQLFNNILSNAIKFRKANVSSTINITSTEVTKIEKEKYFLPEKTFYKIIIEDNGIGFEEEYTEKVFQIFQRLHGKAEYPGSGIGLAICKKIVEKHKGIIFAESVPAKGSTFYILLPKNH